MTLICAIFQITNSSLLIFFYYYYFYYDFTHPCQLLIIDIWRKKLKSLKFIQYHAIYKLCIIFNQKRKKNIYCHTYKQGYKE